MTTLADLALIGVDPVSGALRLGSHADLILGGAALNDLLLAGRVSTTGTGKKARFALADGSPTGDAALDGALARVADGKARKGDATVQRLTKRLRRTTYDGLVAQGLLKRHDTRVLGLIPRTRYTVLPAAGQQQLVDDVRAVLLGTREADERTGTLATLLGAGQVIGKFVPRHQRAEAKKRAKKLAEGEWASEAVRAAIQAADSAVMVAVLAASTAAASGSS